MGAISWLCSLEDIRSLKWFCISLLDWDFLPSPMIFCMTWRACMISSFPLPDLYTFALYGTFDVLFIAGTLGSMNRLVALLLCT